MKPPLSDGTNYDQNPKFDARITKLPPNLQVQNFQRGYVITDQGAGGTYYVLNFLYNPTTVSVSHSVDTDLNADGTAKNPNDPTTPLVPLQQQVSLSLLFDRTFETWDSKYRNSDVGKMGVAVDVLQLYKIVGVAAPVQISTTDGTTAADPQYGKAAMLNRPVGPMLYVPIRLRIGDNIHYYGYISAANVTYTHFTQRMVPNRCQMDLSIQLLPDTSNAIGFGDGGPVYQNLNRNGVAGR